MTIILHLRGGRAAADGPFYALVILTLGLVAGLLIFVAPYVAAYEAAVDACREMWWSVVARAPSPGVVLPLGLAALIVWVFVVGAVRQWVTTWRLVRHLGRRRIAMPHRLRRLADDLGLAGQIDYVAHSSAFAFSYGLCRPRVCLSSGLVRLLSDAELRAVLVHERHHLTSHDPLKILVSRAAAAGLFFLPVARELRDRYLVSKEIAADETTAQDETGDLPLASALLKLVSGERRAWPEDVAAIGAFNVTHERIQRLIDGRPGVTALPPLKAVIVSVAVVVGVFLASYAPLAARSAQAPLVRAECASEMAWLYVSSQ
jgi:Zn-dependent protease with chaperone function